MKNPALLFLIGLLGGSVIVFVYFLGNVVRDTTDLQFILTIVLFSIAIPFLFALTRDNLFTPTTFGISVLGLPYSGKTVYLTVLFNLLATMASSKIVFTPYGISTVEQVTKDINNMIRGFWPPPTLPGTVFFYRATATFVAGFFKRRFKIEVGDFAGENLDKATENDLDWLHDTEYFPYVIQSDAVILAVDSFDISKNIKNSADIIENKMIAAFEMILEGKKLDIGEKLKAPVALTFLKADTVPLEKRKGVEESMERLITFCKTRSRKFKIFWVTSVGKVKSDGSPPEAMKPEGVIDPIVWLLSLAK